MREIKAGKWLTGGRRSSEEGRGEVEEPRCWWILLTDVQETEVDAGVVIDERSVSWPSQTSYYT